MNNTKLLSLALLILLTVYTGIGQVTLSDEEQEEIVKNDVLETAMLNKNNPQPNFSTTGPATPFVMLSDLDDDGMDDDWETDNGLDPTNPKDAWEDADDDYILNLFEFQLETDPNDESSPAVFELSPADGEDVLDDMIEAAENDIRVIRLAQGNYDAEIRVVFHENFRIMIQGGWNDDFTEHNPVLYPTNWFGPSDEALNILTPINNFTVTKSVIILEGVNFMATDGFSLYGAVTVHIYSGKSAISIYDCTMNNSTYYGLGLFPKGEADSSDVFIVNTVIGNNNEGGIYTQVTNDVYSRWRLFNTTINNPGSPEGGIDGLTADQAQLRIELTNCINWGNTGYSFNFYSFNDVEISTSNSNIDGAEPTVPIFDMGNNINEDPLFQNAAANDWSLATGSPCIDAGIDIGLAYSGPAPEMGAIETIVISSIGNPLAFEDINVFPNPASDFVKLDFGEMQKELKLSLINANGQQIRSWHYDQIRYMDLDISALAQGLYFLVAFSESSAMRVKIIKE
jgi:hypothetical protein